MISSQSFFYFLLCGSLMGIANLIPGISAGTIAVMMGIYPRLIRNIGFFFTDANIRKREWSFLTTIFLGMAISILLFSKIIYFLLTTIPIFLFLFFIGLILASIPNVYKEFTVHQDKKSSSFFSQKLLPFILGFFLIASQWFLSTSSPNEGTVEILEKSSSFLWLFLVAILSSSAMVIPGISGTLVLMLFGYYEKIISWITQWLHSIFHGVTQLSLFFHLSFTLSIFTLGYLIGIVFISRIITKILSQYPTFLLFFVLGLLLGTIPNLILTKIYPIYSLHLPFSFWLWGIFSLLLGFTLFFFLKRAPQKKSL